MIEDFKVDDVVKIIDGRSFSKEEKIAHEGEVGVIVRDDLPFLEVKMNDGCIVYMLPSEIEMVE
jgi:hypothetical protein